MESDGETASSQQQEQEGSPEPSLSPEEVEAAAEAKAAAEAAAEKRLVDEAADAAAEAAMPPCSAVRVPVTFTVAVPGNPLVRRELSTFEVHAGSAPDRLPYA